MWYESLLSIIFALPRFRLVNKFKSVVLRLLGATVGKRVVYYPGIKLTSVHRMTIGDDVDFAWGVVVTGGGRVDIGDRVLIGYYTMILSANHVIPRGRGLIFGSGHDKKPVVIHSDVWIGAGCTILPGVTIGEGAVVAAGSVVVKHVEPYKIVGGVPARVIRPRDLNALDDFSNAKG